jgi:hypothetical protein
MAAAQPPRPALMIITRVGSELDGLVKILERTYLSEVQTFSEGFKVLKRDLYTGKKPSQRNSTENRSWKIPKYPWIITGRSAAQL